MTTTGRDIDFADDYADMIRDMIVRTMEEGTRNGYPDGNWKRAGIAAHFEHIAAHIAKAMAGDTTEDHVAHAFTRLAMIEATRRQEAEEAAAVGLPPIATTQEA